MDENSEEETMFYYVEGPSDATDQDTSIVRIDCMQQIGCLLSPIRVFKKRDSRDYLSINSQIFAYQSN